MLDIKDIKLKFPRLAKVETDQGKSTLEKMFDKKREINKGIKKVYE